MRLEPNEPDYDVVRVFFVDGTSTVINVPVDEVIQDAIVEMCVYEGFDALAVTDFSIVG